MLASIVQASGESYAKMTTLGAQVNGEEILETRSLFRFLETVETAVQQNVKTIALEVTSKALSQGFAQRWPDGAKRRRAATTWICRPPLRWPAPAPLLR